MAGMAGTAERQKEWQNGRMAEMATYVLFMVHTDDDDDDDDDDDTLIFILQIVPTTVPSCLTTCVQLSILYHTLLY